MSKKENKMEIHKKMIDRWEKYANLFCRELGQCTDDVKTGRRAWEIAHRINIPREAYQAYPGITDNHIETALKRIFKKVVFYGTSNA